MRQVTYISSVLLPVAPTMFAEVERKSLLNNRRDGLSGLLLFDGVRFLQVLEGQAAAVETTYRRIVADPRHRAIVMLKDAEVERPSFGGWAMLCRTTGDMRSPLPTLIKPFLAKADRSTRAQFESFVQIRAAA